MKLRDLFLATSGLDAAGFVKQYPDPALIFNAGLHSPKQDTRAGPADDTAQVRATMRLPPPEHEDDSPVGKMSPDADLVFVRKVGTGSYSDVFTVGRATSQDVWISLTSVSKLHAHLVRESDGWKIADQRAMNGTFVDGRRLEAGGTARLRDGMRVGFGAEADAFFFTPEGLFALVASHRRFEA